MLRSSFLAVALLLSVANSTPGPTMLTKAPSKMTSTPTTSSPTIETMTPTTSSPTMDTTAPTMDTEIPTTSPTIETMAPTSMPSLAPTTATDGPTMSPSIDCVVTDEPLINSNTGGTNYAVGWFGADGDAFQFDRVDTDGYILWPYRIGVCTALTPTNSAFGIFTCEEGGIKLIRYSAAGCEGDALTNVFYTDAVLQSPEIAAVYPTKCDGSNDGNYVGIEFSVGVSGCGLDTPAYGVLGVCSLSKMYPTFYANALAKMYCDNDGAALEYFEVSANQCDADGEICQRMLIDDDCTELFSTTFGEKTYGRIVECESAEKDLNRGETRSPAISPTMMTMAPTMSPSKETMMPSMMTSMPSRSPSKLTDGPTQATGMPTLAPTKLTDQPAMAPITKTMSPSMYPSMNPTIGSESPGIAPTIAPTFDIGSGSPSFFFTLFYSVLSVMCAVSFL